MKTAFFRSGSVGLAVIALGCGSGPDGTQASNTPLVDAATTDAPTQNAETLFEAGSDGGARVDAAARLPDAGLGVDGQPTDGCNPLAEDSPDDDGIDSNCDGADGVVGRDVYLDAQNSSDNYRGTPDAPVATLPRAIALAQSRNGNVLVRAGNYAVSKLDVSGNWSVYGGYGAGYLGKAKRELTVLAVPAEGLLVANAIQASLHHLTILGANATDPMQRSAHALRVAGGVTVDDVVTQAGNAESGLSGVDGAKGANGTAGTNDGQPTTLTCIGAVFNSGQGMGFQLPNAAGAQPGDICLGRDAAKGGDGQEGSPGTDANATPRISGQLVAWEDSQLGDADATSGFGGPGGGSAVMYSDGTCSSNVCDAFTYCSIWGGGGGTGGCPGERGGAAQSGGGSVAVVVLAGKLTATRSLFVTGFGGNGGNGGFGGDGGLGGPGGAPHKGLYGSVPANLSPYRSAIGGKGGNGGRGGRAGAGAGGWTIGVLTVSGASADVATTTQFQMGRPGAGGQSAIGLGPAGQKQSTYELP